MTSTCPFFYEVKMSKLKQWFVAKYLKLEQQAVDAIVTANFYGNLFTDRQKFNIVVFFMGLFAISGLQGAVQFIALVYIMSRMTPPDKDDKQE